MSIRGSEATDKLNGSEWNTFWMYYYFNEQKLTALLENDLLYCSAEDKKSGILHVFNYNSVRKKEDNVL